MQYKFPKGFLWGTSTAAAQIETVFDHQWKNLKSNDGYIFNRTTDHELRRDEDINYIKRFGQVYRCSVDWSKLQQSPNADFDETTVKEYQDFFTKLNQEGVKIMFVLHHFSNPNWFENKGGWKKEENIPFFVDFCKKAIHHFGQFAFIWNTFNEPGVYAMNSFLAGNFPPKEKSFFTTKRVVKNLGKAHDIVFDLIKEEYPDSRIGISKNTVVFASEHFLGTPFAKFADWFFIDFVAKHFEKNDFWGISYYARIPFTPFPVTEIENPGVLKKMGRKHDMMWEYYPNGLKEMLHRFHKKYKKPIIITESGIATDNCEERIEAIQDYVRVCHEAIQEGVDLQGYTHWSTFDNFEWNLGPTYRFGLVHVDFDKTMDRTVKKSGEYYEQICKNNGF